MTGQPSWYPWAESEAEEAEDSAATDHLASRPAAGVGPEGNGSRKTVSTEEGVPPADSGITSSDPVPSGGARDSQATEKDESVSSDVDHDGDDLADETDSVEGELPETSVEGELPETSVDGNLPETEAFEEHWVTIAQAAELLGTSKTTVRRKLKAGELNGEMAFDRTLGTKRWMVDVASLDSEEPDSDDATLVPMAAIDRLEKAWGDTRDAVARAETAERIAKFEKERRIEAEQERDRLRSLLAAENELAQRIAELEKGRRIQAEKERDRLRSLLEVEPQTSWWVRMRERFRL